MAKELICNSCKKGNVVVSALSKGYEVCEECYNKERDESIEIDEIIEVTIRKGKKNGKTTMLEMVLPEKFNYHEVIGMLDGVAKRLERCELDFEWKEQKVEPEDINKKT